MTVMSGAKALVESLKHEKVEVMFGISGGAVIPFFDELFHETEIRNILVRHEQCAAHMADGFARASGRPGVCVATSGPGATNLTTGIANAFMDSVPVIALTGQVSCKPVPGSSYLVGTDAFQEADTIGIMTPVTKYCTQVRSAEEIPPTIKEAFHISCTGRPGPVLIDIPKDTQTDELDFTYPRNVSLRGYKPTQKAPHHLQIKKAAEMLSEAERPMILAGGGAIASGATSELIELAEYLMIPVTTSLMGIGAIPEDHPLSLGVIGMHGTVAGMRTTIETDLIMAVGLRFSDRTTCKIPVFKRDAKIIHIDIDSAEIGKNIETDVPIVADAKMALKAIYKELSKTKSKRKKSAWYDRVEELRQSVIEREEEEEGLKVPRMLKELRKVVPKDAIICTEVGQNQSWTALYFDIYKPRTFITSGGLGTMGFGFPASIGAKVAQPDTPVLDIAGDGSFIMTNQELATSVHHGIPVVVIILDNRRLGMVAQWQRLFYGRRYSGVNLGVLPDFVKLAESYGANGIRAESYQGVKKAVKEALKSDVTTVIDVPISPDENVYPMVPAGKGFDELVTGWEENE
jgi:acetolactate synthase-1/2/3 large subunit